MKLREMLQSLDLEEVWKIFKQEYFEETEYCNQSTFEYMCADLVDLDFVSSEFSEIIIHGDKYVSGIIPKIDETFGIEYTKWEEWIDLDVNNTLSISKEEALAHILWEASWCGWTNEQRNIKIDGLWEATDTC